MNVLDVGCGRNKVPGAIGIDIASLPGVDVVYDLNKFPWPFEDNCFDMIHCYHYLEHTEDVISVMEEFFRILKQGGKLLIRVPHYSSRIAWVDPTHKRAFSLGSFDYYGTNEHDYYSKARFAVIKKRIKWFLTYPNEKWYEEAVRSADLGLSNNIVANRLEKLFINLIQFLIDINPRISERFFIYLIGGADELYVELQKIS
ncbi:Methyltransferase domain protein [uncultured archaeon]|nr:Methyltransferase domain protein [uncultured archaeon]